MKAKQGAKRATPRLRFPEFRKADAWAEKPLKGICTVNPQNDGLPDSFIYIDLESVEGGVLKSKNRIKKESAPSRAQRLLSNGDVIFQVVRPYQRNNLFVDFRDGDAYVASTGYAQLRAKGSKPFLYQLIHTDSFVQKVIEKCTGSNYPAINSTDLAEVASFAPADVKEQQKVADCLTSLDEVIAAQGRKVEALKAHKCGLMQQLFPCEGETRPRLRFPEFRDAPEWKSKTLREVASISSGTTPLRANPEFYDGGSIPWVKTTDLNNSFIYATQEFITPKAKATINPVGSVLVAMYGGFNQIGRTGLLQIPAATNQALSVLRSKPEVILPVYLLAWLNAKVEDWKRIASSSRKDPNITSADVVRFPIRVPSLAEQQRIADCLSSLDTQITTESHQLAALKTHKQGLMQQLFPAPKAASA